MGGYSGLTHTISVIKMERNSNGEHILNNQMSHISTWKFEKTSSVKNATPHVCQQSVRSANYISVIGEISRSSMQRKKFLQDSIIQELKTVNPLNWRKRQKETFGVC